MPINVSDLTADSAETSFEFNGETVNITYKPSILTSSLVEQMQSDDWTVTKTIEFLCDSITKWDVMTGPKKALPISVENMGKLPIKFVRDLSTAISKDVMSSGEAEKNSDDG